VNKHSSKVVVRQIVEALNVLGVTQIVISPGSRNAPFMLELHSDSRFECMSVVDERSAAFFALGLVQQSQRPVAIICTSGTALLNYAPAVAEAFYQRKKLIVISADRPPFWINKGEGQSIVQTNIFEAFTEASWQLMEDEEPGAIEMNQARLNDFVQQVATIPGPIHLNVPFNEPLYDLESNEFHSNFNVIPNKSERANFNWIEKLRGKKIMVLLGQHQEQEDFASELETISQFENLAVFAELHSNSIHPNFISSIDTLIMSLGSRAQELIQPDVLITVGTNIISRKIKAILRKSKPTHFHIGLHEKSMDTYNCLENFFCVSPKQVFSEMRVLRNAEIQYGSTLRKSYHLATEVGHKYINSAAFSDLKAMQIIAENIPVAAAIQLGNSSIIRYYHLVHQGRNNRFESNRGVAGIDGCTSTAVGYAYNAQNEVYFISGELAFMYDSNAFWNKYVSRKLKVIVINNGGGGIFRIIDGAKDSHTLETLQETPHDLSVENLVRRYGLKYLSASNENELLHALHVLNEERECTIIEVFTPRLENAEILDTFFKAIHLNHE